MLIGIDDDVFIEHTEVLYVDLRDNSTKKQKDIIVTLKCGHAWTFGKRTQEDLMNMVRKLNSPYIEQAYRF